MSKPKPRLSRFQKEMSGLKGDVINFFGDWRMNIESLAPAWLTRMMDTIINHPGTPWFFLGSAIEALGITIQFQYFSASYPIADFIIGFAIFFALGYLQIKKVEKEAEEDESDT